MTRSGDWNARNRSLLEETKRIGAPYYHRYQELKRKRMNLNELKQEVRRVASERYGEFVFSPQVNKEGHDALLSFIESTVESIAIAAMDAVRPEKILELPPADERGYNLALEYSDRRRAAFLGANKE